jgi:hypothetical protein
MRNHSRVLGESRRRKDVMPDFMGKNLNGVAFHVAGCYCRQAHDYGLILQTDHGEARRQTLVIRLGFC